MRTGLLFLITLVFMEQAVYSQSKHPRVVEVENLLSDQAYKFLRGRFPKEPVIATVQIEPLRRQLSGNNNQAENLPYGNVNQFTIQDEWDDPNRSPEELLSRIQRAYVRIRLPKYIGDDEINQMRDDLFSYLNLIPARDRIEFERTTFKAGDDEQGFVQRYETSLLVIASVVALVLILVLVLSIRSAADRIAKSFKGAGDSKSGGNTAPPPVTIPTAQALETKGGAIGQGDDVAFNDRLSLRNDLRLVIRRLLKQKNFPCLKDMIEFHQLAIDDPQILGAILREFPLSWQEKLFSLSPGKQWLPAFHAKTQLDPRCYEFMEEISRNIRDDLSPSWEDALVSVWRLERKMVTLFKGMERDDVFKILHAMPLDISLSIGRDVFPGAWATLLDAGVKKEKISDEATLNFVKNKAL